MTTLKVPPNNIEVEQAILGAVLTSSMAMEEANDFVDGSMFYRPENRIIFESCELLFSKNNAVDTVAVAEQLNTADKLNEAGGIEYLAHIAGSGRGTANLKHYFKILKDKYTERALLQASHAAGAAVYSDLPTNEKLHNAQAAIMAVGEEAHKSDLMHVNQVLAATVDEIDRRANAGGGMVGISTGFSDLDKNTGGLESGNLIIIAGRPSMGKTAVAMNIAERVAINGLPVLIFSLEMPRESLMMRSISSVGRISHDRVRRGDLVDDQWSAFNNAASKLKDSKLWIDDTAALTTSALRSKARRYMRRNGKPALIVVDYIQIMGDKVNGNDTSRITEISRNLKAIAKEFECPLIAISQLNRGVDARQNKRPLMSDLRESGAIEQDADVILMMYRDEYYNEDSEHKGIAECIIGKQRNGPTGKVYLASELQYVRFTDFSGQVPAMASYTGKKSVGDFIDG